ncbi:MAG: hypothetical protein HUU38_27700, partial [Anaerolineales bacterium]|nr:hypothetical protein [Anaerolineales bacterium]
MDIRFSFSRFLLFALGLWVLGACTPVTPTFPVVTQEPGAPLIVESPYPPPVTNTPGPYPPPGYVAATATPSRPPLCQFPGGPTPEVSGSGLDGYVLSEPTVVLTSTTGIGIAAWLPDNERLLLTNYLPDSGNQYIETFNTLTGEIQIYGERNGGETPVWLSVAEGVAYTTVIFDESLPRGGRQELRVSYGNPLIFEIIAEDVFNASLATDGIRLFYFDRAIGDQPQAWNFSAQAPETISFDLTNSAYQKISTKPLTPGATFQIASQPGGTWMAFYGPSLMYLANTQTSQLCEIDLGDRLAYDVQWSPDGRYLAFLSAAYNLSSLHHTSSEAVILDIITGEQLHSDLEVSYIYEMDWGADSRTLAVLAHIEIVDSRPYKGLFLLDAVGGNSRRVLPDQIFGGGSLDELAWSSDGQLIAIKCPIWSESEPMIIEDQICFIAVQNIP